MRPSRRTILRASGAVAAAGIGAGRMLSAAAAPVRTRLLAQAGGAAPTVPSARTIKRWRSQGR